MKHHCLLFVLSWFAVLVFHGVTWADSVAIDLSHLASDATVESLPLVLRSQDRTDKLTGRPTTPLASQAVFIESFIAPDGRTVRSESVSPVGYHFRAPLLLGTETDSFTPFVAVSLFPESNGSYRIRGAVVREPSRIDRIDGGVAAAGATVSLRLIEEKAEDFIEGRECGTSDHLPVLPERLSPQLWESLEGVGTRTPGALTIAELGTEADTEYVAMHGGTTGALQEIQAMVNILNGIYEPQASVSLRIKFQNAWVGEDPYSSSDATTLLGTFASYWFTNFPDNNTSSYRRALALMMTGRTMNASVGGVANTGSLCLANAYAVAQHDPRGTAWTSTAVAHEIGHVFGAGHDASNNPLYIMWRQLQGVTHLFGPLSLTNMRDLILVRSIPSTAICLFEETGAADCPADIDQNGTLNVDDIESFVSGFMFGDAIADINGDGALNVDDVQQFVDSFVLGCS